MKKGLEASAARAPMVHSVITAIATDLAADAGQSSEWASKVATAIENRTGFSDLVEALQEAATWLEDYAREHFARARTAPDGREQHGREVKGQTNADRAKKLRAALTKISVSS